MRAQIEQTLQNLDQCLKAAGATWADVDYGEEGLWYSSNSLLLSGNNFSSVGTPSATAVYDPNCVSAHLTSDNSFMGITTIVDPVVCAVYE